MRGKHSFSDDDKATNEKVEAAIKGIEELYALGKESRKSRKSQRVKRSDGFLDSEAEKRGVDRRTLEDARQLTHPQHGYSETDLKNLVALIRKKKRLFTKVFLLRLLTVRDRKKHWHLLKKVIREPWGYRRLKSELAKRNGRSWEDGPSPGKPKAKDDVYIQIETLCQSWLRWDDVLTDWRDAQPKSVEEKRRSVKGGNGKPIRSLAGNAEKLSKQLDSLLPKWHKALKKWHDALRESAESPSTQQETGLTEPTESLVDTTTKLVKRLENWVGEELSRQFPGRKDSRADKQQQSGRKRTKFEEKAPKRRLRRQ